MASHVLLAAWVEANVEADDRTRGLEIAKTELPGLHGLPALRSCP